jgi:hypothetical protein
MRTFECKKTPVGLRVIMITMMKKGRPRLRQLPHLAPTPDPSHRLCNVTVTAGDHRLAAPPPPARRPGAARRRH